MTMRTRSSFWRDQNTNKRLFVKQRTLDSIIKKQNSWLLLGTLFALVAGIFAASVISSIHSYNQRKDQLGEKVKSLNGFFAREALIGSFNTLDFELNKMRIDFNLQSISFAATAKQAATCDVNSGDLISYSIYFGDKSVGCIEARLEPLNLASKFDSSLLVPVSITAIFMWILLIAYRRSVSDALAAPLRQLHEQAKEISGLKGQFEVTSSVSEFKTLESMLNHMLVRVNESSLKLTEYEREASKVQVARQVAHDIRSPLSALMMLSSNSSELSEPKLILLRNAVARINDIANSLRSKSRSSADSEMQNFSLPFCIEEIVSEKRNYCDRLGVRLKFEVTRENFNIFSKIQPVEFKRVLSNLINNSIEASNRHTVISVELIAKAPGDLVKVIVRDTGCGISREIIDRVFENGFSFNKPGGSGLGLFHAREQVKTWGGQIHLESVLNVGTTVTIEIPQSTPPPFWCQEIDFARYDQVVVVDDSESVHDVWRARLTEATQLNSVYEIESFIGVVDQDTNRNRTGKVLYLVDYEFAGSSSSGLDHIAKLTANERAHVILVTSHAHEPSVVARCQALGLRLLPKSLIALVPLGSANSSVHTGDSKARIKALS